MADRRPPRIDDDERSAILGLLQFQRESFLRKTDGLDDPAASSSPVASGTSLLWLTNHLSDAERIWLLHRFRSADPADDPPHAPTIAGARDRYRATWEVTDAVIASSGLDDRSPRFDDGGPVSLRWMLLHLLEETARHAGHADILRELIDGDTGR